jgi:hypothetical protein
VAQLPYLPMVSACYLRTLLPKYMSLNFKTIVLLLPLAFVLANSSALAMDGRDTKSPYGVLAFLNWDDEWNNYHYPDREAIRSSIAMMKMAHVGIVRLDVSWTRVEKVQGVFDFEKLDFIIDELGKQDIRALGILHYNPDWTGKQWNEAPDTELFLNYVRKTVENFKDRVMYWEIWNEPDAPEYWLPQDNLKAYSALLKQVYPAIKAIDPSAQVLVGGVTKAPVFSMKKIYRLAGKDSFDIVNIHPFVNPNQENSIKELKILHTRLIKAMEFFDDGDKPIWFTEIGCPGTKPDVTIPWWFGDSPSEAQQAEHVKSVYTEALNLKGVDKIFWAFWRDTVHFRSGVDYFGLIRGDYSPKPAFDVYKSMAELRPEKINVT